MNTKTIFQKMLGKAIASVLICTLIIGLTACSSSDSQDSGSSTDNTDSSADSANDVTVNSIMEYLGIDLSDGSISIPNTCEMAVLQGTWSEMGKQYAAQASEQIRYYIASQMSADIASWGDIETVYAALPEYEAMIDEVFPAYLEFVQGVTDGLNEQNYNISYDDVLIAFVTLGPAEDACMAVSAWGSATADGLPYAAIHSDSSHAAVYALPAILAYPDDGNAFMSAVGFSNAYINEKGLVCMETMGYGFGADDNAAGLPACIAMLYNAAYADDAETALQNHQDKLRCGSGEIAQYIDIDGNAGILETTAANFAVRKSGENGETDYLIQANGWLTESMAESSGPDLPDNPVRYASAEEILKQNLGSLTIDDLRNSLSQTSWYDTENEEWVSTWSTDPDESLYSPENKDPKYGCAMRRVFDITNLTMYVLMGSENTLVSKVPESLGTYCAITLSDSPATTANLSLTESRSQIWYAARDISNDQEAGEDVAARIEYLDIAREAAYLALNYQTLAGAASDTTEQLTLYANSISASNKAQCYAKAAQSGDIADIIDK